MPERNIFRRGKTWWLRAIIGGVEHRQSLQCSDVKSARAHRDQLIAEIKGSRWTGPRKSWKEAVADYLDAAASQVGPRTLARYALSLRMIESYLTQHDLAKIDGDVINALIAGRRSHGAGNATIRRDLTAGSQVWEHAGLGDAMVNPFIAKRKRAKERRDPITLPDPADVEAVISRCNPEMGAMMRAAWLTGCRIAELCAAEWRGFNPDAMTLSILGKGNKRRTISLSAEAASHIRAQPRAIMPEGAGLDPHIFRQQNPALASYYFATVTKRHAERRRRAGGCFAPFRFHDLRHLYAVSELRNGRGLYAIQQHLGHTSIAVTESVYLKHGGFLTQDEAENAKKVM